jgi:Tfp pilus assembly protein PilF
MVSERRAVAGLFVAGVAAYWNSFDGAFVFDDIPSIVQAVGIRSLRAALFPLNSRLITNLTFALNYAVGGLRPWGYHLVNLIVHLGASLLLFGVLNRTFSLPRLAGRMGDGRPLAFSIALLWLVHPLQTESVTYIVQRHESLMGFFYWLALYSTIRYAESNRPGWCALAVGSCFLGMATKQVMVTAPLVVLLYDRTFLAGTTVAALRRRRWLYAGLAASWLWLFALLDFGRALGAGVTAGFGYRAVSPVEYARTQPQVIWHYLRLSLWPHPLSIDYQWPALKTIDEDIPALLGVSVLGSAAAWALWRRSELGFAGIFFFIVLAPTSSIMPIADLAVEHRMYLSLAAVLTLVVVAFWQLSTLGKPTPSVLQRRRQVALVVLITVSFVAGLATWRRNQDYSSGFTIWSRVLEVRPDDTRAHHNLGTALVERGDLAGAIDHYQRVLNVNPNDAVVLDNMGAVIGLQNDFDTAMIYFRRALAIDPELASAHGNIGNVWLVKRDYAQAVAEFRRSLAINPYQPKILNSLGITLVALGQHAEAIEQYQRAVEFNPSYARPHLNWGDLLLKMGDRDAAVEHYRTALRIAPDNATARSKLQQLGY